MDPVDLTSEEASLVEAIAGLEAEGEPTSLESIADRAGLAPGRTRVVLSRLLGELGLVQEVDEGALGPYFVLSGRAGAQSGEASTQQLELDGAGLAGGLDRHLASLTFPATTDAVIEAAARGGAPQPLLQALRRLPPEQTYLTRQEVDDEVRRRL